MFKSNDSARVGRGAAMCGVALVALACSLLQAPVGAAPVLTPGDDRVAAPVLTSNDDRVAPPPAAAAKTKGPRNYQLRCWQHGRLLFEENPVTLPSEASRGDVKYMANDRNGLPMYVSETQNATCLVRSAPATATNPALPR